MRAPGIRWLLLATNGLVLTLPIFALAALRIYDGYLLRQTERQLIAQSVVIAEVWRDLWLQASGVAEPHTTVPSFRPPGMESADLVPLEPVADLGYRLAPPQPEPRLALRPPSGPAAEAGRRIEPLLRRAQVFNLSAVRILDPAGCVVATTRGEAGRCLDELPEVRTALAGRYASQARQRVVDGPLPPLSATQRRGDVRLFTALPIFSQGKVIGVVRTSRTSLDALSSLWQHRRGLVVAGAASLGLALLLGLLLATTLATPLRRLARAAQALARGESSAGLEAPAWAPREVRQLADALRSTTRQLRERADYVAAFASHASHELKGPITALKGAAELLEEQGEAMSPEQRRRFASNMGGDASRMERTVQGLLELARVQNAVEPDAELDLAPFLRELLNRYPARVELDWQDPPPRVRVRAELLGAALGNLLDNALRHGAGAPVTLRVGRAGERLRIEVQDRGPGIPPENRARVFQPFFSTERAQGGTGLGLAIVQAVAEARGGAVSLASGPGGSTFTLVL